MVNLRAASSQHNAAEESADVTSAMNKEDLAYSKAVILGIVYSCSIGGISTLIGMANIRTIYFLQVHQPIWYLHRQLVTIFQNLATFHLLHGNCIVHR